MKRLETFTTPRIDLHKAPRWQVLVTALLLGLVVYSWRLQPARLPFSVSGSGRDKSIPTGMLASTENVPFQWQNVVPSKLLHYHTCYNDYECARLDVPMDWHRTEEGGQRMAIAVIRLPAKVPVTDPRYGGPILLNPGGPGGSGVDLVLWVAKSLQIIVDSEQDLAAPYSMTETPLYHDIISFDPRGIMRTTPLVSCFPDPVSRQNWNLQKEATGILGSSNDSFIRNWYRSKALSEGCSARLLSGDEKADKVGEHVNTTPVVRDMVEIIDQHANWVKKQSHRPVDTPTAPKELTKIKYWGFSYGTVIGQTFASMYPDRISRLIVDGVVDAEFYYNGPWMSNLGDADQILDRFFDYCSQSNVMNCPFYLPGGPQAMRTLYDTILSQLLANPLPVPGSATRGPEVITWSDVKSTVRLGMYQPRQFFPLIATLLSDLAQGNGSSFAEFKQASRQTSCPSETCKASGPFSDECNSQINNALDAEIAILCTDAEGIGNIDENGFLEYWGALRNQSKVMGDEWAHERLNCVGWKAKSKWRYSGPFTAKTSHPILWMSNTLDPVTPIENARRMSAKFEGSVVLEQDGEGHCTTSAMSLCTAKHVRAYFQTGVLPPPNTICTVDSKPFIGKVKSAEAQLSGADNLLLQAWGDAGAGISRATLRSRLAQLQVFA